MTCALIVVLCPGKLLRAADSAPANSPSSNAVTASLEYQEANNGVIYRGVSLTMQTAPFKKEPAGMSGKITRGILSFGEEDSDGVAFLWQRDAKKLYLDLNRNKDLTDDPSGVYVSRLAEPAYYQRFTNIHLLFKTAAGECPVLADIDLYEFGSQLKCYLSVRSFWQGKLRLQGRDWQVGLAQNVLDQPGSFESGWLLLRPWEKRNRPFSAEDGSLASVPFSRNLFLNGHAYQLKWINDSQKGEIKPVLQFTEQTVELGELNVTGKFIHRLVLTAGQYLVMLDDPVGIVKVPIGSYIQPDIQLEQNGVEAFCKAGLQQVGRRFAVDGKTAVALHVGGPLTNTVVAGRHGRDLRLDYRLAGVGGETYQPVRRDYSKPPGFAVYKGAKKIASGTFEFG
jgi:hypothetical protein